MADIIIRRLIKLAIKTIESRFIVFQELRR